MRERSDGAPSADRGHGEPQAAPAQSAGALRIAELRVYDEVDEERRVVEIQAVGIKDRDRVFIGGEEIDLS